MRSFVALCGASIVIAGCAGAASQIELPPTSAVRARAVPNAASKKTTATLKIAGGTIVVPSFDGFSGHLPYAKSDAKHGVTLTLTNSGSSNLLSEPTPTGTSTVLFLAAAISGKTKVAFKTDASKVTIESAALASNEKYTLYVYDARKEIRKIAPGSPNKGTLTFSTPLSNVTMAPGRPLVFELTVPAGPTPTPSPTSIPTATPTPGLITEYAVPVGKGSPYPRPFGITGGPNGNVWFTEYCGNRIDQITPAGKITQYPESQPSSSPSSITTGPDGNVWFTNDGFRGAAGVISPTGKGAKLYYSGVNSTPLDITTGPDKNLWFTASAAGEIDRLTTSGTLTSFTTPGGLFPAYIASGPDGNLWFTEGGYNDTEQIGRITTSGTFTIFVNPTVGSDLKGIAAGPDGALWFTDWSCGEIGRIPIDATSSGSITEYSIPTADAQPWGITQGPDGALWFTESNGGKIGRITTGGTITEYRLPNHNASARNITVGPDGNMWFTEYATDKIGRLSVSLAVSGAARRRPNPRPFK